MINETFTPKQLKFCEEYLIDLNGTQAAIRAGYSKNGARVTASNLLTKTNIQTKIKSLMDARSSKTDITAERVLQEIASCAFADIADLVNEDGTLKPLASIENTKVISEITSVVDAKGTATKKMKLYDKLKALEMLGKHLVLFTDKLQLDGEVDVNKVVTVLKINHRKKGEKIEKQKKQPKNNQKTTKKQAKNGKK